MARDLPRLQRRTPQECERGRPETLGQRTRASVVDVDEASHAALMGRHRYY